MSIWTSVEFWLVTLPTLATVAWSCWYVLVKRSDLWMMIVAGVLVFVCLVGLYHLGIASKTRATEIWNGEVTGKHRERVSCSHSYSCMCSTDSKGNTSCQTCYEHSFDVDWVVESNIGESFDMGRVDRQGLIEPYRFTVVHKGDPVSATKTYTNYWRATENSLFSNRVTVSATELGMIPGYPDNIYDHYKLWRVIGIGMKIPNNEAWNESLAEILKVLGPKRQANIVVVLTIMPNETFFDAVLQKWNQGNKNDIIVGIGVDDGWNIRWARVHSWSKSDLVNVELRERIKDLERLDRESLMRVLSSTVMELYERKPMADFAYLESEIKPSSGWMIAIFLFSVLSSLVIVYIVVGQPTLRLRRY